MPFLLVVHPEAAQGHLLRSALRERGTGDVLLVESKEAALAAIDERVPDLVLVHPFMAPADEEHLVAYVNALPGSGHVQTIGIPVLAAANTAGDGFSRPSSRPLDRSSALLFGNRNRQPRVTQPVGCDASVFAEDVAKYLQQADTIKADPTRRGGADDAADARDRRRERRWSPREIPWVSAVRLDVGEAADLINISSGGSLIRAGIRPELASLRRRAVDSGPRSGLIFRLTSGKEIHATGSVVRCRPRPLDNGVVLYEVAFRFDDLIALDLPSAPSYESDRALPGDEQAGPATEALTIRPEMALELLDRPTSSQNELLAGIVSDTRVPLGTRITVSRLTRLNAALLEIKSMMHTANGVKRLRLAETLGPKVHQLNTLRRRVLDSISADDLLLIAAVASGARAAMRC